MDGQMGRWGEMHRWRGGWMHDKTTAETTGKASQSRHCRQAARRLDARRRKGNAPLPGAWGEEGREAVPLLRHPIVPRPDLFVPPDSSHKSES